MVQPGTPVERILEAFMAAHQDRWSKHTIECYRSVLEAYYQAFPDIPGSHWQVVSWLRQMEPVWNASPLKARTRRDYYEKVQHVYRWAKVNVEGGQQLPFMPYESFSRRRRVNGEAAK